MVELSYKDARRFYENNFKIFIHKEGQLVTSGTKSEVDLSVYFSKTSGCTFYVKRSKTHRFLKYLAGQVFIGYYLMASFGLISLLFTFMLLSTFATPLIPFSVGTAMVSFMGYKIAIKARKRITKSLNKKQKNFKK